MQTLEQLEQLLKNYEELLCDMDDDAYVARGNGFCNSKYSEDFLEQRILQIKKEIEQLKKQ